MMHGWFFIIPSMECCLKSGISEMFVSFVAMGCDVFFNMPRHPNATLYTYQLVNVPVQVMYLGPGKMVKITCDWMQNFARYLQQGWKLAEIFWDQGKRSHGGGYC